MVIKKVILNSLLSICFVSGAQYASAQDSDNIVGQITNDGKVTIVQPDALNARLNKVIEYTDTISDIATEKQLAGYRVQVFSDNNTRTAKGEARVKARNISERFPEYRTYVIYNSPFWRLRVGDFRTQEEASDAAIRIKVEFPSYSKEIRVVRDRINNIQD